MDQNLKVFKSDKFDAVAIASLSLFLYPDFLAVFAKDKQQETIGLHFYPKMKWKDLNKFLASDPLLRRDLPLRVHVFQQGFSLVPGALFNPKLSSQYLDFATPIQSPVDYFHTPLDGVNIQLVSYLDRNLKTTFTNKFSEVSFSHGAGSLLSYIFKERFNLTAQEILVQMFGKKMFLVAFKDQELCLFNSFDIRKKADLLKYVFSMAKQAGFSLDDLYLRVYGLPKKSGITVEWLEEYLDHVEIMPPHANQQYSHGFKRMHDLGLFEVYWQYA